MENKSSHVVDYKMRRIATTKELWSISLTLLRIQCYLHFCKNRYTNSRKFLVRIPLYQTLTLSRVYYEVRYRDPLITRNGN